MKTTDLFLALAFSAAALSPAYAKTPAKTDAAAVPAITDGGSGGSGAQARLICRRQETTGARTGGERVCLTKDQWRVVNNGGSVTTYQKRVR